MHFTVICYNPVICALLQRVADVGIVESITLKNFMCHSLLGPFTFGSNVNFVVGSNGSGKSAVLTALIVALGGNAQATNRGSSLKGFVKEGESSADVSITLCNKGRDAFKPEAYGTAINVDLRITREGLRTYKLRSKSGNIISTKKEELMCILDNLNIQVNNPVSILTQEMSKYFLHSKGEGDKYRFFMKATQLEQMREDFVYIKSTKHITEDKMSQQGEELKQKYQEKMDRYKSLASLDEMHSKLEELQKQMAWALVRPKLQSDRQSTGKYDEKVEEWKVWSHCEEAEQKYKQIQDQLEGITQRIQELQPQCTQLKTEVQKRNSLLKSMRMEQIRAELENMQHQISTLGQQINQYEQASSRAKDELNKMRYGKRGLANRKNLQIMESSRSNCLRRFGEHMPALLSSIQEAHRKGQFKQRPRGPLGYCISLKDPELALAVEVCLKSFLHSFTCDNYDDEKVLQGLMARVLKGGRRPTIITSAFLSNVHDTTSRAVNHPEYPSVLQALEIEDPVVANCLIDQRGIESILLIKNRTEARRVMQRGNPPRNCNQAFSVEGDQIFTNRTYTADQPRAKFLSSDIEEEIRCVCAHTWFNGSQGAEGCPSILLFKMNFKQNMIKGYILTPWLQVFTLSICFACCLNISYSKTSAKVLHVFQWPTPDVRLPLFFSVVLQEELSKSDQEGVRCKHHKKHYEDKRKVHLKSIETLEASLNVKEQELAVCQRGEICPERTEVRRTAKSLDSEISRLKTKITTQQGQQGDREEIVRQYHEALTNYKDMKHQVKNLNNFIKTLDNIISMRLKAYADLRRFLSARCKYYFDSMLAQRGYTGSMTFDHKNETLSITVQPGAGNKADLSDMRSLSGGERSFSTVCFVLSLWAITEAPFRCLDEFDVYMDMVNRRISMDMMLKVAASQRNRQFIFLTPQSMSTLPETDLIRILRLKDPDRSHGAGQRNGEEEQD
uniref:Structural maintenance of chromosomes protein 6 n=1 Tax=Myripristis murdjan TaxID=586833 RepID=A0A667ZUN7_9TELE